MAHDDPNSKTGVPADFPAVSVESRDGRSADWNAAGNPGLPAGQFKPGDFAAKKSNFHHTDPNPPGLPAV